MVPQTHFRWVKSPSLHFHYETSLPFSCDFRNWLLNNKYHQDPVVSRPPAFIALRSVDYRAHYSEAIVLSRCHARWLGTRTKKYTQTRLVCIGFNECQYRLYCVLLFDWIVSRLTYIEGILLQFSRVYRWIVRCILMLCSLFMRHIDLFTPSSGTRQLWRCYDDETCGLVGRNTKHVYR